MGTSSANLVLAPDAAIDLQLHTVYSDGKWLPEQLIDHLVSEKFALVAITDHDRVDTISGLQQLAAEKHLSMLVAVEMTTRWRGEMVDVLCYGFDPENNQLNNLAQNVAHRQRENTLEVYHNLLNKGYLHADTQVASDITAILEKPSAQQPHELVALLKKYYQGSDPLEPGKLMVDEGFAFAATDIDIVVDAAHRSGAVALVAHPGRGGEFVCFDTDLLGQLRREVPIDGFEVYYPTHTPEQIALYVDYARKHRLLTSSGSDSHGPDRMPIPYRAELSRNLLDRFGIQIR